MAVWRNSDGLNIRLGNTEAEVTRGGELRPDSDVLTYEVVIDLANVASASAILEDTQDVNIPSGWLPQTVEVTNEIAATGAGATLNLGLIRYDQTTVISTTALLAAAPRTDFAAAGNVKLYQVGVTGAGALLGTTLANPGYLTAFWSTAAFTAGRIRLKITGWVPRPSPSNP